MSNNNALSLYQGGGFETMQRAAQAMVQSGYFKDSRDIAQAVVKVMAGAELGISPFAAMSGVHIVQGKPTLSSNLIATLVKNDPRYDYRVKVATDTECVLIWFENGDAVGESSFTMQEANNAGLTGKSTWKQYASDMLFARALTRGARRYAPGIFGGAPVYTPEEVGADLDYDGNIVTIEQPKISSNGNENAPSPESRPDNIAGYRIGDEVMVRGSKETKPGVIVGLDFPSWMISVKVNGNGNISIKPDRLTLIDNSVKWEDLPSANPNDGARDAETVKAALVAEALKGSGNQATDKQVQFANSTLNGMTNGNNAKRKAFLRYVFGIDSGSDLSAGAASAIIDWSGASADNGYASDPTAVQELERIYSAALKAEGQQSLL